MSQEPRTYAFSGGLDTNSAALFVAAGGVIASSNYEPLAEGYGRMEGIERFDGRPAPSDATYWTLPFNAGSNDFAIYETITGAISGATGVVVDLTLNSGAWGSGTAQGFVVLANVSGAFINGESVSGSSGAAATAGPSEENSSADLQTSMDWTSLAQTYRRSLIQKVPGQGPVRGVAVHDGLVYAWRDAIGGASAACFKATSTGWQAIPVLTRISFTAGSTEIIEGNALNGASSGATATALSVIKTSGSWASGTAVGFIDLVSRTGNFTAGENLRIATTAVAVVGVQSTSRFAAGGRYRTLSHNFFGQRNQRRLYGTYGTGPAFEICPEGAVMINTGSVSDLPYRVFEINNHLGLIFPGGSVQFSGTGEPRAFDVLLGAGEIGFGTEVTDVLQANDTAVAIFGENKVGILQGRDANDFALDTLTEEAGALPDTAQRIAKSVYIDARGMRDLSATQAFGDFKTGALSILFENYLRIKKRAQAQIVGSYVCKTKSQYRFMYNDGTGLSVFMGGKRPQALAFSLGEIRPYCFAVGEMADGEAMFCGAEDGYVYRLDKGNTIDGGQMSAFCMTAFNSFGNALQEKRIHKLVLEVDAPPKATIGVVTQFDYADGEKADSSLVFADVHGGGGTWDASLWDTFFWSSPVKGFLEAPVDGIGRNASFIIVNNPHPAEAPHVLQAHHVYTSPRKLRR